MSNPALLIIGKWRSGITKVKYVCDWTYGFVFICLVVYLILVLVLACKKGSSHWPWLHGPPVSSFRLLGLKVHTNTLGCTLCSGIYFSSLTVICVCQTGLKYKTQIQPGININIMAFNYALTYCLRVALLKYSLFCF